MFSFETYTFYKIFDMLLQGNLRVREGHVIPSAKKLGKKAYCKWHNSFTHATNDCTCAICR
jgi:hypothetical protein